MPVKRKWIKKVFRISLKIAVWLIGLSLFFVILFKWVPVPVTPLMVIRTIQQMGSGKGITLKHHWVSRGKISPDLQLAVVCSEDQNFLLHHGFDLKAIEKAMDESKEKDGRLRGASTISQQTAKNVFLWPQRSWVRKGLEVWFTGLIELFWSKRRILTVYLNSIEMGRGIYGAEAASQFYFNVPASRLSRYQAASLAAILPSPQKWNARSPGPYVQSRIEWILGQMQHNGPLNFNKKKQNSPSK